MGLFSRTNKDDKMTATGYTMRQHREHERLARERNAVTAREIQERDERNKANEQRRRQEQRERERVAREQAERNRRSRENEERHKMLPSVWQVD